MQLKSKYALTFLCFFLFFSILHAEVFRVHKTHIVDLSSSLESVKVSAGVSDAIVIKLPKDRVFLQGLSFEVKIPRIVASYRDSVAYSIYRNISPAPKESVIDYSGERLCIDTFPGKLSHNIQVPLRKKHSMKGSPYSVLLPVVVSENETMCFFRLQQVMKGVPTELMVSVFEIEVKPVFTDEGMLIIEVVPATKEENVWGADLTEQEKSVATELTADSEPSNDNNWLVYIDEKDAPDYKTGVLLPTGLHHVAVVSEAFRNEIRTITIEQAKKTNLAIELKDITPTIQISAPENTTILLDDIEFSALNKPVAVKEGEHTIKMVVGDYETVRTVQVKNGKSYTISLSLDVKITEE